MSCGNEHVQQEKYTPANQQPIYIHIPRSRIIILKLGKQYRRLYLDVQPTTMAERRARLAEAQRAAAIVRQVNPKPKYVVTVIIGPTEVQCDLELLQHNCDFFARGKHGMAYGLPACDVSLEAFMIIYKWMAKPNEVVLPPMLMSVFKAAMYLKIQVLIDQFMVEFRDPYTAREEIGFHMFFGLHKLNVYVPFRKTLRVHKYFLTLIGTKDFLNLWPNALVSLLDSPNICVNSEVEVLIAVILWLHHDYQARCSHTEQLLGCVRFDSIPLEALLQLRQHTSINGLGRLLFRPEIEMFLKRAPSHNNNIRYCNRRIWVYDQLCEYHHDAHCPKRNFITLGQFKAFQLALRNAPDLHWWHRHQLNPYVHNCRHEKCRRLSGPHGRR
ncbi:uncharacterized protein [Drosophila virilis]|uniref:BACK domain-containing protein n=1 Tax=Drosophila virilis TaxID=7244 RepID=B4MAB5_DROVI|nr:uncharacterized protein LOC6634517 [Drosophila virilis]XP_032296423.1 uncharacterized protein LOC6634517 [Drosophila virilis]EDW66174.1 uncharacterized protein Dvir_GJ15878 [Drosophila virilis]